MAIEGKRRSSAGTAGGRRSTRETRRDVIDVYVDGSNALVMDAMPAGIPAREEDSRPKLSEQTRANRERSMQMNVGYVAFLTITAVITVMICVNYLRLQAGYTALQKQATGLESQLSELKLANDAEYNRIIAGVDMEHVKEVAMGRLGMVYASSDQIVLYDAADKDYVKQYREVPDNG